MMDDLQAKMLPAPLHGGFRMDGYWVWCGSVVKGEDEQYHMFASRWGKHLPMHPGWLFESEIVHAVSAVPEGPYVFSDVALGKRSPAYWDGRSVHNPCIKKHDGKYLLFYSGSTHPFADVKKEDQITTSDLRAIAATAGQRIGLAIADSPYGPWKRPDQPFLTTRPDSFDSFMVNNPAPIIRKDGSVYLLYKSRGYQQDMTKYFTYDEMKFGVAEASHYTKQAHAVLNHPLFDSQVYDLEDPFVWQDEDGRYFMIAKDMDGHACGEARGGVLAASENGLNWEICSGKTAYSRNVLWDDGKVRTMGNLERPFMLFEDGKPTHLFFATSDGENGLVDCKHTWNMVIPLKQD